MTSAIQQGRFAELGKHLHADFRANEQMTAEQVKQMLAMYSMQHQSLSVTVVSTNTVINPVYADNAETTLSVVVTSGNGFAGLPSDGSVRVVKLQWRKDDDWKILKADWEM